MYTMYTMYTVKQFRQNLRQAFNDADQGHQVVIERFGGKYQLISLVKEPLPGHSFTSAPNELPERLALTTGAFIADAGGTVSDQRRQAIAKSRAKKLTLAAIGSVEADDRTLSEEFKKDLIERNDICVHGAGPRLCMDKKCPNYQFKKG